MRARQHRNLSRSGILPGWIFPKRGAFLDHAVFGWNHPKTENVIDSNYLEHAFREKPLTLFPSML
jgi:hypothetical protein